MSLFQRWRVGARLDGTIAIEYGLILPVLLLLTLGIMDIGRLLWTYITLTRATEAAARCAAVNTTLCGTSSAVQDYAVQQAWGLNDVTAAQIAVMDASCGKQVTATYNFKFIIPWPGTASPLGSSNAITLSATACYPPQF